MLLLYTPQSTLRLQYICKFIFEEILGTSYSITIDEINFDKYDGNKINYSNQKFNNCFKIIPHTLLFEAAIKQQTIECFDIDNYKAFFKTENADFPFDIFAASFYLIARYEEYLPYTKDAYGRYAHENALAYKAHFLNVPLINIWLNNFSSQLKNSFPTLHFKANAFNFKPTYDIDIAWAYKEKGLWRNLGGFLKSPSILRLNTLLKNEEDPYDCYNFLNELHEAYNLKPLYFFLVAKENGQYDKNILPDNEAMQLLIKTHTEKYEIGIHPSWKSNDDENIVHEEIKVLENIAQKTITSSRQHYIKFNLPYGYNRLIAQGLKDDYSMGYGSINGFRASVASSFWWYDLLNEKITNLRIHPFCFMDANSHYEQQQTVDESYEELMRYYMLCKKYNATLITIFHNNILGTTKEFAGWAAMYKKFIAQVL